jgi:hypothetical protein
VVSRPSLPLDEQAELVGEWWLPGEEDQSGSGRLLYEPVTGLHIEVVGGGVFKDPTASVPWVLGLTVDGRRVTLRGCDVLDWGLSMPGGVFAKARVAQAFVGMHASGDAELRLHSLRARIANLGGWLDARALEVAGVFPRTGTVGFSRIGAFDLGRSKGVLLTASVDLDGSAEPATNPQVVSLEQRPWVTLAPRRRRSFDELLDLAETFRGFLSFASGVDSPFLELEGMATVQGGAFAGPRRQTSREPVSILFAQRERGEVEEQPTRRMLFRYVDVQSKGMLPLARWLRRADRMGPVYSLYLAALPVRALYLEHRFLTFSQALDAFYFRKHGKEAKLQPLVASFVGALPRRLRGYVPAGFAELVKDTRHYLTHWNPRYEAKAAKGERLHALTRGVKLLFELAMLQELGFQQREILALVESNSRLIRDVDGSWRSL